MTRRFLGWRTASLLVALPLAVLLYGAADWWNGTAIVFPASPRSDGFRLSATAARPVFTHSVIPGGAYSSEELRDVFRRDAVVAAHYRDADLGRMQLTTRSRGKAAYVSYRIGDKIYWTRNRVWISPGESVLTDGVVEIRARCGNCISDTRGEVAAVEPASGVLDESVIPPTDDARVAGFAAEAEPDLAELLAIPFGPQALESFAPQLSGTTADSGAPLWPQPPPFFGGPPGGLPGGPAGPDHPGDAPGDGSSPPPAPFVPGDGGSSGPPTSGGSTSGSTTGTSGGTTGGSTGGTSGSTTSGTPGTTTTTGASTTGTSTTGTSGTPTTGTTGDTTTNGPGSTTTTGSPTTGWPTTGATDTTSGIVTTNGSPTSGVASGSTDTGQPPSAPEANLLWLVAVGALGLASRHFRRRR